MMMSNSTKKVREVWNVWTYKMLKKLVELRPAQDPPSWTSARGTIRSAGRRRSCYAMGVRWGA
jgi:hypothetical protein